MDNNYKDTQDNKELKNSHNDKRKAQDSTDNNLINEQNKIEN